MPLLVRSTRGRTTREGVFDKLKALAANRTVGFIDEHVSINIKCAMASTDILDGLEFLML